MPIATVVTTLAAMLGAAWKVAYAIHSLDKKIDTVQVSLDKKIDAVQVGLQENIRDLDKKIDTVQASLKDDIHGFDRKIDAVQAGLKDNMNEISIKIEEVKGEVKVSMLESVRETINLLFNGKIHSDLIPAKQKIDPSRKELQKLKHASM